MLIGLLFGKNSLALRFFQAMAEGLCSDRLKLDLLKIPNVDWVIVWERFFSLTLFQAKAEGAV